ncbi:4Fe-4S binding protein [Bacteroides sp. UBA939]|uniref:4Fe-4S binding protein n=1 Tax=Bacteroides sp. UBA939 TaxID=1946092 RepID=UPI0025B7C81E|nr:4Fe-4S binding protein [Bacteroides sp. UBA939]
MDISEVHLICFSPTYTSKQVGEAIVRGIGFTNVAVTDLTLHVSEVNIPQHTLTVIVVPVYGGKVAPLAMERLQGIRAAGAPVVLVVVYGNRAYGNALVELDTFASAQGFKVIAGSTFIGEHSYSTKQNPIAAGRPDGDDLLYAETFGRKIRTKLDAAQDMEYLYPVDVSRIQRPRQPFLPLFKFLRRGIKLRKSGIPLPRIPNVDAERCNHCAFCVERCPAGAIIKGDECNTIAEKCIKCCACVKGCPRKARTYDTPYAALLAGCFVRQKEPRIII